MNCLVTGGAGFIGSNLVHALVNEGHVVDIVDNMTNGYLENLDGLNTRHVLGNLVDIYEEVNEKDRAANQVLMIESDFADSSVLRRIASGKYDVVFHLAANPRVSYTVENPYDTTEENLSKTVLLTEAVRHCKQQVRFVFSSTCAAYGNPNDLPVHENAQKHPESPYGWQKGAVEDYLKLASRLYGLESISLRYFNVYGPRQRGDSPYSTAISAWCDKISKNESLRFDGDGSQTRDMIYVSDVVQANILAAKSKAKLRGDVINIGTGKETSNIQIINAFRKKFENLSVTHAPARKGDVERIYANVHRAKDLLGFESTVNLVSGLTNTFLWWKI